MIGKILYNALWATGVAGCLWRLSHVVTGRRLDSYEERIATLMMIGGMMGSIILRRILEKREERRAPLIFMCRFS